MNNTLKEQIINYLDLKDIDCYQAEEELFCEQFDLVTNDDGDYEYDNKVFNHIDQVILYNDATMNAFVNAVNEHYDNYYAACFN